MEQEWILEQFRDAKERLERGDLISQNIEEFLMLHQNQHQILEGEL